MYVNSEWNENFDAAKLMMIIFASVIKTIFRIQPQMYKTSVQASLLLKYAQVNNNSDIN